jgi:hypothetical protein
MSPSAAAAPAGVVVVSTVVPTVLTLVVETAPPGAVVEVTAVSGAATAVTQIAHSRAAAAKRGMSGDVVIAAHTQWQAVLQQVSLQHARCYGSDGIR